MRSVCLSFCVCLLGALEALHAATPGEVGIGKTLGEASLSGLNGPDRALSSLLGQPLLINVWASWCGPCRAEMASLERLAWRDPGRRYAIIGISTDDDRTPALRWLQQSHGTISHYIDRQLQMENMLGASSLPLTVLVNARGQVLAKIYGAREWDSQESLSLIARTFGPDARAK